MSDGEYGSWGRAMLSDEQWTEWEELVEGARAAAMRIDVSADQLRRIRIMLQVDAALQRLEHIASLAAAAVDEIPCACVGDRRCVAHRLRDALSAASEPVEIP